MLNNTELLYKIATMYYVDKLNQAEIGDKLLISRPTVSRALARAEEVGIVSIAVIPPAGFSKIEIALAKKLGIERVVIAPQITKKGSDKEKRISDIAQAAGKYVDSIIHNGMTVGLGWGVTIYRTVLEIPYRIDQSDVTFVPLVGSPLWSKTPQYQVNIIVDRASEKCRGKAMFFNIPAYIRSQQLLDYVLNDSELIAIKEAWGRVDLAIVGLGNFEDNTASIPVHEYSTETLVKMKEAGVIGDILGRFFSKDGFVNLGETLEIEGLNQDKDPIYLGIPVSDYKNLKQVLCLAGGNEKVKTIVEASRLGLITKLVTDKNTADELMRYKIWKL